MRLFLPLALCIAMGLAAAQAQENAPVTISPQDTPGKQSSPSAASPPTTSPPAVVVPQPRRGLRQHFEDANTTRDGRLTPAQAQASWPMVAKHFAEIDKNNRGYVTIDDIRMYRQEHRRRNRMPGTDAGAGTEAPATGMSIGGKPAAETPDTER